MSLGVWNLKISSLQMKTIYENGQSKCSPIFFFIIVYVIYVLQKYGPGAPSASTDLQTDPSED